LATEFKPQNSQEKKKKKRNIAIRSSEEGGLVFSGDKVSVLQFDIWRWVDGEDSCTPI
jgi:hypothetical protein